MVIQVIPAQFFFELFHAGVLVDQQEFNPGHFSKVAQVLSSDRVAETGVVRPARENPGCGGDFEIGTRQPQRPTVYMRIG